VMLDDPSLTTRLPEAQGSDPVRVILDAQEYLDKGRKIFDMESDAPTWIAATEERDYPGADDVIRVPQGPGGVDMTALMKELGKREITSVLIEGGGTTHASALEAGVVDKAMFFVAPKIIGGREAISAVEGTGADRMSEVVKLQNMEAEMVGDDLLIQAYVAKD